jgi:hypothetical protein
MDIAIVIMRAVAGLLLSPVFNADPNRQQLSDIIAMAANLAEHGDKFKSRLEGIRDQLLVMVDEQRAPTADEWDNLKTRYDSAHARIQAGQ